MHNPYRPAGKLDKRDGINDPKGCLKNVGLFLLIVAFILTLSYVLKHHFGIVI